MVKNIPSIWSLLIFIVLVACSDKKTKPIGYQNSNISGSVQQQETSQNIEQQYDRGAQSASLQEPQIAKDQLRDEEVVAEYVEKMGAYIKALRHSSRPMDAEYPMGRLFLVWNPEGRNVEELKRVIGKPTAETDEILEYWLPDDSDGLRGSGYVFDIKDGKVIRVR